MSVPDGKIAESGAAALAAARASASFDVEEVAGILALGGLERRRELAKVVRAEPVFNRAKEMLFESRETRCAHAAQVLVRTHEIIRDMKLDETFMDSRMLKREISIMTGADLHDSMFIMTLMGQMNEEQQKKWIPLVRSKTIIGTYAQTEMGHGSNLRALETTATYDPRTETWDIHSPTLTSAKWWPGGLGKSSTHCVLMARLITKGKDYGTHPFLVQLRRQEDHLPVKGVTIGDIGPKLGFITQDNGYLLLNHVKVPRDAMLMRFSKVDAAGNFTKPPHAKLTYGTMIGIRAGIVRVASMELAKACTIAVRYSFVRRQFGVPGVAGELSVMEYQTQQFKLLPLVAAAYAFHFTGAYMGRLYMQLQAGLQGDDFSSLAVVHATSSGLKSVITTLTAGGIETCRRACGGHGYSNLSGLPELYNQYVAACTYEGENTLLQFQTARYLLKQMKAADGGAELSSTLAHLTPAARASLARERCTAGSLEEMMSAATLTQAYRHVAARVAGELYGSYSALLAGGMNEMEARNASGIELCAASQAHCMFMMVDIFSRAVPKLGVSAAVQAVLEKLFSLFALVQLQRGLGAFLEDGYMTAQQAKWVRQGIKQLLPALLPEAVGLVDAFGHSDEVLCSSLGRRDGRVYRDLWESVKMSHLNRTPEGPGYKYLRPLLQQGKWPSLNLDTSPQVPEASTRPAARSRL